MVSDPRYQAAKELAQANRAFYDAFRALDLDAMREVWLEADNVKCVHPGWEMLVGYDLVMRSWEGIFENTESISFEVSDLEVEVIGDAGVVTLVERVGSDGGGTGEMAATNVFVRSFDAWKMVMHHASPIARRVM